MKKAMKKVRSYGCLFVLIVTMTSLLSGCGYVEWWINSANYNANQSANAERLEDHEEQSVETVAAAETPAAPEPAAESEPEATPEPTAAAVPETTPEPTAAAVPETTPVPRAPAAPGTWSPQAELLVMENVEKHYVDVEGPVMYVTLFNGEVLSGPLSSVETYFTSDDFDGFSMTGFSHLTQTRNNERALFETDDVFCPSIEWSLVHPINDFSSPDVQDQSFSILTADGVRLISMLNVQQIVVEENVSMQVPEITEYERPEPFIIPAEQISFEAEGTVLIYLKDGTVYTSYPDCFQKISTANNYLYTDDHPNYSQTRDFWIEEAKTLSFTSLSEIAVGGNDRIYEVSGTLSNGERVKKFVVETGSEMRFLTKENGIISLPFSEIDHIDVDMSVDADFSGISKVKVLLTNNTSFELPATAMEYMHYEGGGIVQPHPVYDYFFYTGSAEFLSGSGYTEEDKELPFSEIREIVFHDDLGEDFDEREFPADVTFKDGSTETLNFRFYNYYGNALELYCPFRVAYGLDRDGFMIKSIQFE